MIVRATNLSRLLDPRHAEGVLAVLRQLPPLEPATASPYVGFPAPRWDQAPLPLVTQEGRRKAVEGDPVLGPLAEALADLPEGDRS